MVKIKKPNWVKKLGRFKDDLLQPIKKNFVMHKRINEKQTLDLKCDVKVISNVVKFKDCEVNINDDPIDPNPNVVIDTSEMNAEISSDISSETNPPSNQDQNEIEQVEG